ncbi:MAG: cyclic nucleotide-binding domain-containing protein [Dehalococcoidia bacterium]
MAENTTKIMEDTLTQVPIFKEMSTKAIRRLAATAHSRHFPAGETILTEGEPGIALYVLARGKAEVLHGVKEGHPQVVAQIQQGDFFGEMALLDTYVRTASVRALDECECITLTKWDFMAELRRTPDIAVQMLPVLGRRIRQLEQQMQAPQAMKTE